MTAEALQAGADDALVGWIIRRDQAEHPGRMVARLILARPTPYVLLADTLVDLRALLPFGLERSDRQLGDPPDVVEMWFVS
jgi:hypothetical protein